MTASQNPPFLSLRKRLLQCAPGRLPRSAVASATVKTGGWEYVRCATPSSSKSAKSSSGVINGGGIVGHDAIRMPERQGLQTLSSCDHISCSVCGCSSGVEHNLAKVGVGGSNPLARSIVQMREPRETAAFRIWKASL